MANNSPGDSRRKLLPLLFLGIIAILSVTLPGSLLPGAGPAGTAQASTSSAQGNNSSDSKTIHAKALNDHECDSSEWGFVITQVHDQGSAPSSIDVTWANGDSETVNLSDFTGHTAHYITTSNLDSRVVS